MTARASRASRSFSLAMCGLHAGSRESPSWYNAAKDASRLARSPNSREMSAGLTAKNPRSANRFAAASNAARLQSGSPVIGPLM